jgi:serine/threonine protein kinase
VMSLTGRTEVERSESRARFFLEASLCSKLSHPGIVTVFDFGEVDADRNFISMEFIEGVTLERHLEREKRLEPEAAVSLLLGVARALRAAHERGVVHRDLKPGNLMLTGPELSPKLVDFGLVRDLSAPRVTQQGAFFGTAAYLAPESTVGTPCDHRVDLYSLGVILFECLTGRLPFDDAQPLMAVMAHIQRPPPRLTDVHPALEASAELHALVAKLLAKEPSARVQTAAELVERLRRLPEGKREAPSSPPTAATLVVKGSGTWEAGALLDSQNTSLRRGLHQQLKYPAVLQLLPPVPLEQARAVIRRSADWNRLEHPNYAPVCELGTAEADGARFGVLVHRSAADRTLRQELERRGSLAPDRAWTMARQLFEVLAAAHHAGLTHGRVTPQAVLLTGEPGVLALQAPAGLRFEAVSTGGWAAPEVASDADSSPAADVYAAARVVLSALTAKGKTRSSLVDPTSSRLLTLLRSATEPAAAGRPSAADLKERLTALDSNVGSQAVWILGEDPVFAQPSVRQACEVLRARSLVIEFPLSERRAVAEQLRDGTLATPAAVLFGDLPVLLEDPVLALLRERRDVGRLLLSTHSNAEMLSRSINFCGIDRHVCLPASVDDVLTAAASVIRQPGPAHHRVEASTLSTSFHPGAEARS